MPIILQKWQEDEWIRPLFGWKKRSDNTRRFRQLFCFLPRKNGKSLIEAGIGIGLITIDDEPGAEVFVCARNENQARKLFTQAKRMVKQNKKLSKLLVVMKDCIMNRKTGSTFRVIANSPDANHGHNVHGAIIDEYHTHKTDEMVGVLRTGMGSRRQPILMMITTAGKDRKAPCGKEYDYAKGVLSGKIHDPEYLPIIYEAPADAPWDDPKTWALANPNYPHSPKHDFLKSEAKRAKGSLIKLSEFRQLQLNQWQEKFERAISQSMWDKCLEKYTLESLLGKPCYAGLDLSSVDDLTCFALIFPDEEARIIRQLSWFWCPEDFIEPRFENDRVPYPQWHQDGFIETTGGDWIDYEFIFERIKELASMFQILECRFDPWKSTQIVNQLASEGMTMTPITQGFSKMGPPTREVLTLIKHGKLKHNGHPVMEFCATNAKVKKGPGGDFKFDKDVSDEKIDGLVALTMAASAIIKEIEEDYNSHFEKHGIGYL